MSMTPIDTIPSRDSQLKATRLKELYVARSSM